MDPDALAALGGRPERSLPPVRLAYLLRIGAASGLAAAVCNTVLWLVARARGWSLTGDSTDVDVLPVVLVSILAGVIAALGTYFAARTTKRPAVWTAVVGVGLLLASLGGLPPTLRVMHLVTGAWVITWLTAAVRGGSHVRDQ